MNLEQKIGLTQLIEVGYGIIIDKDHLHNYGIMRLFLLPLRKYLHTVFSHKTRQQRCNFNVAC